ncbi:MAG: AraC family transcriptional regulator [Chloroflexota bacterium]
MDVLTDILGSLRFKGSLYFRTELTSPWSILVPAKPGVARFHIVIRGQGWLRVEEQTDSLPIANGDLAVVPHGAAHTILDEPATPARPLDEVLSEVNYTGIGPLIYGGGGPGSCLVCGEFGFADNALHPLLANLPPLLHIPGNESYNTTWLDNALGFIAHEAASEKAGSLAIVNRLSEIIFIQVIRAFADASHAQIPFLAALSDPQISQALSEIHANPASHLTVEGLGRSVGMSRSAFSNRFSELVSMTPHQYITFVRLQHAAHLLSTTDDSLMTITDAVGYQSEAAFSTAFKRHFGIRPGEYRQKQGAP